MQVFNSTEVMKGAGIILFLALLFCIAWIDYHTKRIPDRYTAALLVLGILSIWIYPFVSLRERIGGGLIVSAALAALLVFKPGCFGGGDIKLMAAAGIGIGWKSNLWAFVLAVLGAGIYVICQLLTGRKKWRDSFAFGPFLCGGITAAIFCGECLTKWFLNG
ncbi:MAG: A24 family peptidase [Muricomes sp.]